MFLIVDKKLKDFRKNIVGIDQKVPILNSKTARYINFDNAASTPPLASVVKAMMEFLPWYSGVHRGTGYKSLASSWVYDDCHQVIGSFVKADLDKNTVIILKNTTEAINKLSYRLNLKSNDVVVSTLMEHHSNDLPWRRQAIVKYAGVDDNGFLDVNDVKRILKQNYPRVRLLAVCGASNVTGHLNDIHTLAELAHEFKARILVDGAQLIPHCPVDMKADNDPRHIDYLAFSGHKIYAPFGTGVLIGPKETFLNSQPEYVGGGTVSVVTPRQVFWGGLPDREEAGSPNVIGAMVLSQTIKYLQSVGMEKLCAYEQELGNYAVEKIKSIPGIKVYGSLPRVGVISFNIEGIPHQLVGAILCYEAGIGVRTGCFCAQSYVRRLLGEDRNEEQIAFYSAEEINNLPGMVRISLAAYNTRAEIDTVVQWLQTIANNRSRFHRKYRFSSREGSYLPYGLEKNSFAQIPAFTANGR